MDKRTRQFGGTLIETVILVAGISLLVLTSSRQFSWWTRCELAVSGWAITMRPAVQPGLVYGTFGNCPSVYAWGDMNTGVRVMESYLCELPVDSDWVMFWRVPCGL